MALEDRIRTSVDPALAALAARVDTDARAIVDQIIAIVHEDQAQTLATLRAQAAAETERLVEEAEARGRARERDIEMALRAQAAAETERLMEETEARGRARERDVETALRDEAAAETRRLVQDAEERARVREHESDVAALARLLDGIRGLDGASSLSEVLDALGHAAAREASRAAVLVIRQERLIGWKVSGFGHRDAQPKTIDLGLTESGVLSAAVSSARPATTRDNRSGVEVPQFARLAAHRLGVAVPVIVGGRVVALVYADEGIDARPEDSTRARWPELVEILARHAGRCLEALTVQRTASAASPRFWVQATGRPAPAAGATPATLATERPSTISEVDGHSGVTS